MLCCWLLLAGIVDSELGIASATKIRDRAIPSPLFAPVISQADLAGKTSPIWNPPASCPPGPRLVLRPQTRGSWWRWCKRASEWRLLRHFSLYGYMCLPSIENRLNRVTRRLPVPTTQTLSSVFCILNLDGRRRVNRHVWRNAGTVRIALVLSQTDLRRRLHQGGTAKIEQVPTHPSHKSTGDVPGALDRGTCGLAYSYRECTDMHLLCIFRIRASGRRLGIV